MRDEPRRGWRLVALITAFVTTGSALAQKPAPDLILVNGNVALAGLAGSPEAIAIRGDRIADLGGSARLGRLAGPRTRVIDVGGRTIVPGLVDAHTHPGAWPDGTRMEGSGQPDDDPPLAEVLRRLMRAAAGAPKGRWIFGTIGAAVLDDPAATRFALDRAAPDRRVLLTSWTGHGVIFNTRAMRDLGLREDEPDPPGGFFRRAPGRRTIDGLAHEYAGYRIVRAIASRQPRAAIVGAFHRFAEECARYGITTVHAMMTSHDADETRALLEREALPIRLRLIRFPIDGMRAWRPRRSLETGVSASQARVYVSGTKWILDGTPVERLAYLREPYADRPGWRGRLNFEPKDVDAVAARALAAREPLLFHAVGDAAIDVALNALWNNGGTRWRGLGSRIEHADLIGASQAPRASAMGLIFVQNPSHFMIPSIMRARLGDARAAAAQPFSYRSLRVYRLMLGSDGPLNPWLNLLFATQHANNPKEALPFEEAMQMYASGRLRPGAVADVAVLSQDVYTVALPELPRTTSVLTIVGGRVVHDDLTNR